MPVTYPELPGLVVVDATGPKDRLNAEVWRHARLAEERGLALVLEVYARSVLASRRLTEWWKTGDRLMTDTLAGIYLLRVDLLAFGPEAVLGLTPYGVVGAPLFVGWNAVGQVCGRTQFDVLTPEAMALPLSAFFEDVLAGRAHTLNPTPSLGSAERTREAAELRRVGQALRERRASTPPSLDERAAQPAPNNTAPPDDPPPPAPALSAPEQNATGETIRDTDPLATLLNAARADYAALEDTTGVRLDLQLENLRALDTWLDAQADERRLEFARRFGAVIAVYVGDTIRRHVTADWVWDDAAAHVSEKLVLEGEVLGAPRRSTPVQWVVATLGDATRSLYGQALAWCRIV